MKTSTLTLKTDTLTFPAHSYGEGPLVLCLHGFPDTESTFQSQIPALVEAGYRVVTPTMRGYSPACMPKTPDYQSARLGLDVIAMIDALEAETAVVLGHDWGAIAAQFAALAAPERVEKLITAAVPCGPALATRMMTDYGHQKRLWYQYFFNLPMAEAIVAMNDLAFIRNLWRDWSPDWDFAEADIAPVLERLALPGVLGAALAYYKPLYDPSLGDPALAEFQGKWAAAPFAMPCLHLQGRNDGCIAADCCEGMEVLYPKGLRLEIIEGAGHFLHREAPDRFNRTVLEFLAA